MAASIGQRVAYVSGCQQKGCQRGCGNFYDTKYRKSSNRSPLRLLVQTSWTSRFYLRPGPYSRSGFYQYIHVTALFTSLIRRRRHVQITTQQTCTSVTGRRPFSMWTETLASIWGPTCIWGPGSISTMCSDSGLYSRPGVYLRPGFYSMIYSIQKFCELCWGRDGYGRTNHERRTMHISDVIHGISKSSNALKSLAAGASPQTPLGSLQRSPDPIAGFKRVYFWGPYF